MIQVESCSLSPGDLQVGCSSSKVVRCYDQSHSANNNGCCGNCEIRRIEWINFSMLSIIVVNNCHQCHNSPTSLFIVRGVRSWTILAKIQIDPHWWYRLVWNKPWLWQRCRLWLAKSQTTTILAQKKDSIHIAYCQCPCFE